MTETDRNAMVAAAEELLSGDDVKLIQFNGPAWEHDPPIGLMEALQAVQRLAVQHGKQLIVSPI
jgi:hypothetical protein